MSVNNRDMFGVAALNREGRGSVAAIRDAFNNIMDVLENECPPSSEFDQVKLQLQVACMLAIRSSAFFKGHRIGTCSNLRG